VLYHNPQLLERVQALGVVDRFLRLAGDTLEAMLSLCVSTSPEGLAHIVLLIDYVSQSGKVAMNFPLALYPMPQQMHAQEDALLLSRKWDISLRRATPTTGWEHVRLTDDVDASNSDLMIGG
jgi:hypothetical protein